MGHTNDCNLGICSEGLPTQYRNSVSQYFKPWVSNRFLVSLQLFLVFLHLFGHHRFCYGYWLNSLSCKSFKNPRHSTIIHTIACHAQYIIQKCIHFWLLWCYSNKIESKEFIPTDTQSRGQPTRPNHFFIVCCVHVVWGLPGVAHVCCGTEEMPSTSILTSLTTTPLPSPSVLPSLVTLPQSPHKLHFVQSSLPLNCWLQIVEVSNAGFRSVLVGIGSSVCDIA